MVRLNLALFAWNRAETITCFLVAEPIIAGDNEFQLFGDDSANLLKLGLQRVY